MAQRGWLALLAGLLLQGVQAAEPLRVLTEHAPPGEYLAADGRVTGPTAEMVRELLQRAGESAEIELLPWMRAYQITSNATAPVALFETSRTPEREAQFKWVGPIKRIRWGLYDRAERARPLADLEQARQATSICTYIGDGKGDLLAQHGFSNLFRPVKSQQCFDMLRLGRDTLWLSSDIEMENIRSGTGLQLQQVLAIDSLDLYIAFSLATPDATVRHWQATLDAMKREGSLARHYRGTYADSLIEEISQVPVAP